MKKSIAALILLSLAALALLGSACGSEKVTLAAQDNNTQGITVSGEGKVSGTPDVAVLSLGVSSVKPTVKEARDDAAGTMQNVINAIKGDGVADKDVQTTQYNISPEYDYPPNASPKLTGYRVTNTVTIKVRDVNTTSQVLDDVTAAGGDIVQVQGITFTIDNPETLQDQARGDAVTDAKARAQRIADSAGVTLGAPISISEGTNVPAVPVFAGAANGSAAVAPSTPIETGQLDVDITVQVVFAIQ
ncbi:MAG: SIMPL domain-containing protein [Dehalococcoidia bacterium]|jgi:uncharacterized protein YggE